MIRYCGAKVRSNNCKPCQRIACQNGRCHLHGGHSTGPGPVSPEGRLRQKMASWKHGQRSKEAIAERKAFRAMIKQHKRNPEDLSEN